MGDVLKCVVANGFDSTGLFFSILKVRSSQVSKNDVLDLTRSLRKP